MKKLPEGHFFAVVEFKAEHALAVGGERLIIDRDGRSALDDVPVDPAVALWLLARAWARNVPPALSIGHRGTGTGEGPTATTTVGILVHDA